MIESLTNTIMLCDLFYKNYYTYNTAVMSLVCLLFFETVEMNRK